MISRYDNLGRGKGVQKSSGFLELTGSGPLGQIARNGDDVRFGVGDDGDQRLNYCVVSTAKMNVRKMDERADRRLPLGCQLAGGGTITCSAPGQVR